MFVIAAAGNRNVKANDSSARSRLPADVQSIAKQADEDLSAQRYDAAAACYQRIIDQHPDSLYAWSNLGVVRSEQGHADEAVHAFRRALQISPRDVPSLVDLGMCFFDERNYDAAIPPFERAEKLMPGNANIHALLAQCYAQTGRDDEARQERQTENLQQIEMFR